jgi:hypothetical protein
MSWQLQHTSMYNLPTHDIDKIVQTFGAKIEQVYTDEQDQLKSTNDD